MSDMQLGKLAPDHADRDATHVAVVPVIAAADLHPGQHCGLADNGKSAVAVAPFVGIVDPFLPEPVKAGQRFYLCLYPRTVTGLRHHYLHPALDGDNLVTSRDWIERWADLNAIGYNELMWNAKIWAESKSSWGDYWVEGGRFEGVGLPDEFWDHYDRVTGTKTPEDKRHSFFSCSC